MLRQCALGFGTVALAGLYGQNALASAVGTIESAAAAKGRPHFTPKVRNVIFLYMDGGVSAMDSFDPQAALDG